MIPSREFITIAAVALLAQVSLATSSRCPQYHKLELDGTPEPGYGCDMCDKHNLPQGTPMHECRKCAWYVCNDCYAEELQTEAKSYGCPEKHVLEPAPTQGDGYGCDMCDKKGLPKETPMYGCRKCNWDACVDCINKTSEQTKESYDKLAISLQETRLEKGDTVTLQGLKKHLGRDFNGVRGTLVDWRQDLGQWCVQLEGYGKDKDGRATPKAIIPECLTKVKEVKMNFKKGECVTIKGLKKHIVYNGCQGKIIDWSKSNGRWKVELINGPNVHDKIDVKEGTLEPYRVTLERFGYIVRRRLGAKRSSDSRTMWDLLEQC